MARSRKGSRNTALSFYVNGRRAKDLEGLTDIAGNVLSSYDQSVIRAVVSTKRRVVPVASRAVREHYGVKARALSQRFRVQSGARGEVGRPSSRIGRPTSEYLSLWASTRRIPLLDFGGRWGGPRTKGAVASVERGQSKVYESAFLAVIRGRRAIRVRKFADASYSKRHGRGPVQMLYGPSAFEMVSGLDYRGSRAARDAVLETLRTFYLAELGRQFKLRKT